MRDRIVQIGNLTFFDIGKFLYMNLIALSLVLLMSCTPLCDWSLVLLIPMPFSAAIMADDNSVDVKEEVAEVSLFLFNY